LNVYRIQTFVIYICNIYIYIYINSFILQFGKKKKSSFFKGTHKKSKGDKFLLVSQRRQISTTSAPLSLDDAKSRKKTMYMHTNTCTYIKDEKKRREREREKLKKDTCP